MKLRDDRTPAEISTEAAWVAAMEALAAEQQDALERYLETGIAVYDRRKSSLYAAAVAAEDAWKEACAADRHSRERIGR